MEQSKKAGFYQVAQINGKRCSAAKAYLVPVLERDNLTVMTDTQVNKILIDGNHARGQCIDSDNNFTINASKEVILSSGAFGSPQILLRSELGLPMKLVNMALIIMLTFLA